MEPDFSGYATKAGLKCTDGRVIMPGAFKHQDKMQVPLVWQHGHNDPTNVVGHAILEDREDGVYAYGFFNDTEKGRHAKAAVQHKDVRAMSIWANELIEKSGRVLHGAIREVSLVLSGANPGALIEQISIRHADGDEFELEDEVIIYSGEEFAEVDDVQHEDDSDEDVLEHADDDEDEDDGPTVEEVYNSMSDEQKNVLHYLVGEALASKEEGGEAKQSATDEDDEDTLAHSEDDSEDETTSDSEVKHSDKEGTEMTNVFESNNTADQGPTLSHSEIEKIVATAKRTGSLKAAVEDYGIQHGIQDIDVLFPEAQNVGTTPEWDKRRTEWVSGVLGGVRKSPFSRIKTMSADITVEEARAKGYIKGTMKKEEFFRVKSRVTTPTTIYKKQKLDRDDMIDITDFDVVTWLKGEMRLMLDEELARAILIGDGRAVDHEDKISEDHIRPIATDHEAYTTKINVNIDDANSTAQEIIDAIVANRRYFKGSGMPTMYTTETYIAQFLLLKDTLGRRIYKSLDELASELRVSAIVPVEVMEEETDLVCVLVNLTDYSVGADKGGNVSMFDDFDIDYNQYKYLIETRVSGALTKLKSALAVWKVASTAVLATPEEPGFDSATGVVTIPDPTGVQYEDEAAPGVALTPGDQAALNAGESVTIVAVPESGYYFSSSVGDSWTFTRDA